MILIIMYAVSAGGMNLDRTCHKVIDGRELPLFSLLNADDLNYMMRSSAAQHGTLIRMNQRSHLMASKVASPEYLRKYNRNQDGSHGISTIASRTGPRD